MRDTNGLVPCIMAIAMGTEATPVTRLTEYSPSAMAPLAANAAWKYCRSAKDPVATTASERQRDCPSTSRTPMALIWGVPA